MAGETYTPNYNGWHASGSKVYESGVDRGMLYVYGKTTDTEEADYPVAVQGHAGAGVPWNGLTAFNESPEGADANDIYADNIKYLTLRAPEDYKFGIEALASPVEFDECDGQAGLLAGTLAYAMRVGQQRRKTFGLCCRTNLGEADNPDYGYKLYIAYGCTADPSDKNHETENDNPDAATMSWDVSTIPVVLGTIGGVALKDSAKIEVTCLNEWANAASGSNEAKLYANIKKLECMLYGGTVTSGSDTETVVPFLPTPAAIYSILSDGLTA